jgi:serine/threonine-protein kinase
MRRQKRQRGARLSQFDIAELAKQIGAAFDGQYRMVNQIGQGGMGTVFRIESTGGAGTRYALKLVKKTEHYEGEDIRGEIQMLRQLEHPNIPRIITAPEDQDYIYIVQELVEGISARELVDKDGPLDVDIARRWMYDVADAMAYLHGQGILHRDIKPTNLMVTPGGEIKIIDFGLAKRVGTVDGADERVVGTKQYTPPERYSGAPADEQTDIYEYGATFFMLMTGQVPPVMRTRPWRRIWLMHQDMDRIPSEGLKTILRKCTALRPRKRYRSFQEIKHLLQAMEGSCAGRYRE